MLENYYPQTTSTPTILPTNGPVGETISISLTSALLAFTAFVALVVCIGLVILWGRKLEKQAFQHDSLVEALAMQDASFHKAMLIERLNREPIEPITNPLPQEAAGWGVEYFWQNKAFVLNFNPNTPENQEYYKDKPWEQDALLKLREWGIEELKRIEKEKSKIDRDARERAKLRIPESMDKSLLGGGFTFILEFSTVIVIIFSVVILGIIGILKNQEIATILAAIAGYVLGKATGFLPSAKEQTQTGQKKTEDQEKKIEEYEKKIEAQLKEIENLKKPAGEAQKKLPTNQNSRNPEQEK